MLLCFYLVWRTGSIASGISRIAPRSALVTSAAYFAKLGGARLDQRLYMAQALCKLFVRNMQLQSTVGNINGDLITVQQGGVSTSDYGVQLALCLAGECGFFCPASLLQPVEAARSLRIFTVPELQEQLHIECIRTVAAVQPAYIRAFESALLQVCRSLTL